MRKRCHSRLIVLLAFLFLITTSVFAQPFGVYRELWTGLSMPSNNLQYLTNTTYNPNWPDNPDSSAVFTFFETEINTAVNNYGQRVRAFIIPPTNGTYTFWVSSDDSSQLFLSTDENPDNKSQIAWVNAWTSSREWTKETNQQSAPISLLAGRRYYIEAIMQQGTGGDNFAVRWQWPDGTFEEPIPAGTTAGPRLVPCCNQVVLPGFYQAPTNATVLEGASVTFSVLVTNQSPVTYQWCVNGTNLTDSAALTPSYSVTNVSIADSGRTYTCIVSNSAGAVTSPPALLTVNRDTTPPTAIRIMNLGTTNVQLLFSKPLALATATNTANYVFTDGLAVSQATLSEDLLIVTLTTPPLVYGSNYTLVVNGLQDCATIPNTIATNTTLTFLAGLYAAYDIGGPTLPSTTTSQSNGLDVVAVGTDIGGGADQFAFNFQIRTGDFDISARVPTFNAGDLWAKAGLMARETLDANSRFVATFATPSLDGVFMEYRIAPGLSATSLGSFPVNYPYTWLRLRRAGGSVTGYASYDGQSWTPVATPSMNLSNTVYIGVAVCSHNATQPAQVQFRDLTFRSDTPVLGTSVNPHEILGPSSRKTPLVISEIMYKPAPRTDGNNLEFVEIFNSNPYFHDISGYKLLADNNMSYTFPQGTILQGGAFLVVAASPQSIQNIYGVTNVFGPYTGSLKKSGTLQLLDELGSVLLTIPYSYLNPWPAGAEGTGHSLVLAKPTYGEADPRAWDLSDLAGGTPGTMEPFRPAPLRNIVINELLVRSTNSAVSPFVELYNHSTQTNDISGCILTDNALSNRFVIPLGTTLTPAGFISFATSQLGFDLNPAGGIVYLLSPDGTQILNALQYEPQADGVSLGRSPEGSETLYAMTAPTPGAANSSILIGDIVINELMYNPITGNDDDQYVELYNKGSNAVSLANWQFTAGINFTFPTNTVVAPNGYLVVARNKTNLFAKYPNLSAANTVGDFTGKLSHGGERVALAVPQPFLNTNGTATTNYVVEDEVTYGTGGRWGQWAAGGGSSLELINPRSNHRLAANWNDSDETAKSVWTNIETTGTLTLGANYDSTIDFAQIGILDVGECLVDNIEVRGTNGVNVVANSTFENGASNWTFEGCHYRSSLESSGYGGSSQSLHIRTSDHIWTGLNSCEVGLTTNSLKSGQTATLRFKARWLRGCPEVLLRLAGNWLETTGTMPLPANLGTPGAPNSCYATNAGPAVYNVTHFPAVPAANQPIQVTARVQDPDGLAMVLLYYRVDPATTNTMVVMRDDGKGSDPIAGDGIYTATIPGLPQNTIAAFYIVAVDRYGTSTRFPALLKDNSPDRECVVMFGDPTPAGAFGVYRLWITQANATRWANLSNLSNEGHDCTIVNGNRIIYNAQGRYTGSPYHQQYDTPYGHLCSYKWMFPDDDKFLGATSFNKIHQPGNGFASYTTESDGSMQREQTANSLLRSLGVPWLYRRFVVVYVNGNRRGQIMEDAQTPDADVVDQWHPNDANGFLYKMQPWFEFPHLAPQAVFPSSVGNNNNNWCTLNPYLNADGTFKIERYRYNYLMRRTPDSNNNYTNVYRLVIAGCSYGSSNYVANMESVADMENWMRLFAANHAAGNWDSFGAQNGQNLYGYIGTQGTKYTLHMFDFNIALGNKGDGASWDPGQNLFTVNSADPVTGYIFSEPTFRRMYWRAMQELCDGPLNTANSGPLIDAKYTALTQSGLTLENTAILKNWMTSARNSISSQMPATNTSFAVSQFQRINNTCIITGTAPVGIKDISVNGVIMPVTWTGDTTWKITTVLKSGTNTFNIAGIDIHGTPVAVATNSYMTSPLISGTSPVGNVVINEIMNNPAVPGAQYIELYNNSTNQTFDLSNWQLRGLGYVFPPGATIAPTNFLVLAADRDVFSMTYGFGITVFDTFAAALPQDAATLTLVQPGADPTNDLIVARVKYENALPWPTNAPGTSLELIDSRQDNWRVANWANPKPIQPAPQWVYVTATGTGSSSNLYIYLQSAGDIYIDDMKLVAGTTPEAGTNLLSDGNFESTLHGPWTLSSNLSGSSISTAVKHSGNSSLHVVSTAAGTTQGSSIWQTTSTALQSSSKYTLSFWYLQSTNGGPLTVRLSGNGISTTISPAPPTASAVASATPGTVNVSSNTLAAFQQLWINEVQADNLTSITNSAGQHAPWIELYNPTTNSISLNGIYLANNYTNLTNWAFPASSIIQPGQFKVIFADGRTDLSTLNELHTSFSLSSRSGKVALSRISSTVQVLDYINYTNITPDRSYGSFPDGQSFQRQEFYFPSPGATNNGTLAPPPVFINEWMAGNTKIPNPIGGKFDDWFELYNAGTNTVDLAGYYLTSQLTNQFMYLIPSGYAIPSKGYLLVWADKKTPTGSGDLHVNFKLSKSGTSIGLFRADGVVVDSVTFGPQTSDISQGRYPDGSSNIMTLPVATPRAPNYIPNTAPTLSPIADVTLVLGQTLAFTASALDTDLPAQTLTFSLEPGAPAEAQIDPASGQFSWTPAALGTNLIGIVVADSGSPFLTATQRFTVSVVTQPTLAVTANPSQITFNWQTLAGQNYQIEYKDNLDPAVAWTPLGDVITGTGSGTNLTIQPDGASQRFYRLRITPWK